MLAVVVLILAVLLAVAAVWIYALDRSVGTALKRTEELDSRLREHGL